MPTEEMYHTNLQPEYDKALAELETMTGAINFKPRPVSRKSKILDLFKLIPGLSEVFDRINDTGENFSALMQLKESLAAGANVAQTSFHGLRLGLAIIDFIRIPAIFLAAALLGKKVPLTLSKVGKWAYAGAMVALAALMIAIPGAVPIVGVIIAGFILGNSIFTLGRLLYQRYQLKKDLKNIAKQIHEETQDLNKLQLEAQSLKTQLKQANEYERTVLLKAYVLIKEEYDNRCKSLQTLYDKKEACTYKLAKRDNLAILDKTAAVFLSAGILIGVAIAIAFPPVGFAIAAACAAVGILYLIGRVAIPFLAKKIGFNAKEVSETKIAKDDLNEDDFKAYQEYFELVELNNQLHLDRSNNIVLKENSETDVNKPVEMSSQVSHKSEAIMELALGIMPGTTHHNSSLNEDTVDDSTLSSPILSKIAIQSNPQTSIPLKIENEAEDDEGEGEGRPDNVHLS
ncbi:coiled-coil protein [Legionella busanensis]|uniref:Coiled-coil protein n=1 Tax=Legionella busanensis TaxID=190655 RepID=A0A378JRB8_9GAMM|nr:hypothetical protein [Legionella busanensis]STX52783.1 coiled-coil protein [Legionella busanensis]